MRLDSLKPEERTQDDCSAVGTVVDSRKQITKMSPHTPQSAIANIAPTSTSTSLNAPVAMALDRDDQTTTNSFLMRSSAFESMGLVEDDSTDIYLFTRCSPLNDF
jgi:hypothetical protein